MMRVDHQQQRGVGTRAADTGFLCATVHQHAQATAIGIVPLLDAHLVAIRSKPGHVLDADLFVVIAYQEAAATQDRVGLTQLDHAGDELEQRFAIFVQIPVDPANLAVLAVGIVVAVLSTRELIARHNHRRALCQQQGGEQVAHLTQTQAVDFRIFGRTFNAVVPGQIVVAAVLVVFVVGFVVLVVVRHQVMQRETIVRGDEVHGRLRTTAALVEHVAGRGHARSEVSQLSFVAFPEGTNRVAELVVPFHPAWWETAHLVAARTAIPWLGDQFDLTQHRVLTAGDQEAVALVETVVVAAQNGRQVEAEAVDVHFRSPVTQGVGDHLQYARVAQVEGVASARVVDVVALVVRHQAVVRSVVDTAHRQGRAQLVAFGGVVVDHIEDDLETGVVQVRNHFLEFGNLAARQVTRVRGEERDAVVAPIVGHALLQQMLVVDEGMNRQQLDGGHTQLANVLDDRR